MAGQSAFSSLVLGAVAFSGAADVAGRLDIIADIWTADFGLVALHGALGGSARWLFLKEPWREGMRLMILGAVLAAGVGNMWRLILKQYFGDVPESLWSQPEAAYSGAFLIGLLSVAIMGRFVDCKEGNDDG